MTTRFVEVPGGRLQVVDEGSGPPIALLHAGIADFRSWEDVVLLLHDAGYRTIRYDQRGQPRIRSIRRPPTRVPAGIRDLVREMDLLEPARPQGKPIGLAPPASERLSELRCPILAVAGELDLGEVAVTARHLEANAPNARAVIWPDVAHMIGMEQPKRLADAVVEFIAPLERWS